RRATPQLPNPAYISLTESASPGNAGYAPSSAPSTHVSPQTSRRSAKSSPGCFQALAGLIVLLSAVIFGWWFLVESDLFDQGILPSGDGAITGGGGDDAASLPPEEQSRKQALSERTLALGVDKAYLTRLTDQLFYERHSELQGTQLTGSPEDAALRAEWDAIASDMLTLMEQNLSTAARGRLGRYSPQDLDRWKAQVNQRYVSTRALYDLADGRYAKLFPGRTSDGFVEQPADQIWFALAQDRVNALESGNKLSEIKFERGSYSQQMQGSLDPGEGFVYTLNLSAGQLMRLNLQASSPETLLSLYLPSPTNEEPYLLSDSTDTTWSGELPQTGYYEIVIVSTAEQPISYQLNVAVDTVIENPPEAPAQPEAKD
ncbi:MAG TPA: hypothetical protein V6D06_03225, partial [Trichocoleus sp.]